MISHDMIHDTYIALCQRYTKRLLKPDVGFNLFDIERNYCLRHFKIKRGQTRELMGTS